MALAPAEHKQIQLLKKRKLYKALSSSDSEKNMGISDYAKIFDNVDMFLMLYYRSMSFCLNVHCV